MDQKGNQNGSADAYEQRRLDWQMEVKSADILLPELLPMVADYSYAGPEFRWYTRREGTVNRWLSCKYKETLIHVIQYADHWSFTVVGHGSIEG